MGESQHLNILILGGQSSVGLSILSKLSSIHTVRATFRSSTPNIANVDWNYLDISKMESIETFLRSVTSTPYDVIINLIGELSHLSLADSLDSINEYFQTYISNHSFLIRELVKTNLSSKTLFINSSSRSVVFGSHDSYYSQAKSAIHGLIKSLAIIDRGSQYINLVPGLIKGSSMYWKMTPEIRLDHERRAGGTLVDIDEFVQVVASLVNKVDESKDLKIAYEVDIYIGPQYK